jgi:hypothetical protein
MIDSTIKGEIMKSTKFARLFIFTALVTGGLLSGPLLGGPMQVQAAVEGGPHVKVFAGSTVALDDADQGDELANEANHSEEVEQSSTDPEYKYVPVRRFAGTKK